MNGESSVKRKSKEAASGQGEGLLQGAEVVDQRQRESGIATARLGDSYMMRK